MPDDEKKCNFDRKNQWINAALTNELQKPILTLNNQWSIIED
jgi:hypothetical protein